MGGSPPQAGRVSVDSETSLAPCKPWGYRQVGEHPTLPLQTPAPGTWKDVLVLLLHSQALVAGARKFLGHVSFILGHVSLIARAWLRHTANKWSQSTDWRLEHLPCPLYPISPEGAVPTGQQVVEDIERGLAGGASGHTQLLQKHRLRHGCRSEVGGAGRWEPGPGGQQPVLPKGQASPDQTG